MTEVKMIDRTALHKIAEASLPALQAALAPFGVTVKPGRSKYSNGSTGTLQFELVASGADPERETFERYAGLFGLKATDYDRPFTINGERYVLRGIEPGRPKYPIVGERCNTGGRFKFTEESVTRALAREPQ